MCLHFAAMPYRFVVTAFCTYPNIKINILIHPRATVFIPGSSFSPYHPPHPPTPTHPTNITRTPFRHYDEPGLYTLLSSKCLLRTPPSSPLHQKKMNKTTHYPICKSYVHKSAATLGTYLYGHIWQNIKILGLIIIII